MGVGTLSVSISLVLLVVSGSLFLVFSLLTHSSLFVGTPTSGGARRRSTRAGVDHGPCRGGGLAGRHRDGIRLVE